MNSSESRHSADPHGKQPVLASGPRPEDAASTLILIHGRGGSAESMLSLYDSLSLSNVSALVPQAAQHTWYPLSFLAPLEKNEPYLGSALQKIESIVSDLIERGVSSRRIAILGFSQGACLALEFAARHPRKYGAIISLTGGLIGPPDTSRNYKGSLEGTPVFLGSGDPDPHVPYQRVIETKEILEELGAAVELRRYPGMPHTINEDEIEASSKLLASVGKDV